MAQRRFRKWLVPIAIFPAAPAAAQEIAIEDTIFAGDYLAVGVGAAVVPSYSGSDDVVFTPVPLVQGSLGGIGISPRAAGIALDFVPSGAGERVDFDLGVAARLRSDRAVQVEDEVVASLGKLDRAIEIGPSVGMGLSRVLHPYDNLSFSLDAQWDVNGAHRGTVVSPTLTYLTPLSRGIAATLSLSSEWADGDFHDYYYRITPAQSAASGGVLPTFAPEGAGFTRASAMLLMGADLNGDLTDGGWALFGVAGYTRLLGDAQRTGFTSAVGSADQMLGAFGIGYAF